jgi:hypothetical protein
MVGFDHPDHPLRMTDGGFGPPIPSATDDGWGVSLNPSVSVIRRLWIFLEKKKNFVSIIYYFLHRLCILRDRKSQLSNRANNVLHVPTKTWLKNGHG